jgi:chromosomal replication initiation ATPase DnaA
MRAPAKQQAQLALPLRVGEAGAGAGKAQRIVLGNANAGVAEALANPQNWPYNAAILMGPPRSGKSLLGKWFAENAGDAAANNAGGGAVIDGADGWDETELFHRWNRAQADKEPLLLIADNAPWKAQLPDLASRLGGSLQLEIGSPDDAMVADLLSFHAELRGAVFGDAAAAYLVPRIERSFAIIEQVAEEIDRISLERKAAATMSIWRDALSAVQGPEQARLI